MLFQLKASDNTVVEAGSNVVAQLLAVDEYISSIATCQREARMTNGRKEQKESVLKDLLSADHLKRLPAGFYSLPLPFDLKIKVLSIDLDSTFLFKSAMYPAVINFFIQPIGSNSKKEIIDNKLLRQAEKSSKQKSNPLVLRQVIENN